MIPRSLSSTYLMITSNIAMMLQEWRRAKEERALQRSYRKMAALFFAVSPVVPFETIENFMPAMMRQLREDMGKTSQDPTFVRFWVEGLYDLFTRASRSEVRAIAMELLAKVQET